MIVNAYNQKAVNEVGYNAIYEALGPAGFIRFIQQFDSGSGDYTKEKYNEPDITNEQVLEVFKDFL